MGTVLLHVECQAVLVQISFANILNWAWPRGYKTFSMLNSAEHEIHPAHKC